MYSSRIYFSSEASHILYLNICHASLLYLARPFLHHLNFDTTNTVYMRYIVTLNVN